MAYSIAAQKYIDGTTNQVDTYITVLTTSSAFNISKIFINAQVNPAKVTLALVKSGTYSPPPGPETFILHDVKVASCCPPIELGDIDLESGARVVLCSDVVGVNIVITGDSV